LDGGGRLGIGRSEKVRNEEEVKRRGCVFTIEEGIR